MPAPPDRGFGRLAKTLLLLDAPSQGERVAALEVANQQLAVLGLSWADVAAELPTGDGRPAHIRLAARLMREGQGIITPWETKFLVGIEAFERLTPKQRAQLDGIGRKVRAKTVTL